MRVRFFGGSKDGEWLHVIGERLVRVAVPTEENYADFIAQGQVPVGPEIKTETYLPHKLRGESRTFVVYAPSGWGGDELMGYLVTR